jgi:heme-degrading monooxygenase HmoA
LQLTTPHRPNSKAISAAVRAIAVTVLTGGLMGFSMAMPYRAVSSPGTDSVAEVIVVITEVRLGGDRSQRSQFWNQVWTVEKSLPKQPGLVGYALRREIFGTTAWTMTLWKDEASIRAFVRSGVHRNAVMDGLPATFDTRFVRFRRLKDAGPPDWAEAIAQLTRNGRSY